MNDANEQLDARLRAAFAPPPERVFAAMARSVVAPPRRTQLWPWLMAAAAVLLTIGFAISRPRRGPDGHDGRELGAMWAAAYEHALASTAAGGTSCCDAGADFCGMCEQKFDVRIAMDGAGEDLRLQGCYCGLPIGGCVAALASWQSGMVGLFVVPISHDPKPSLPADSGLYLTRREIGSLAIYAVSSTPAAAPLEQFVLAP